MKRALSISCLWICLLVLSSSVIMGQDNHLDITPTPQSLVQKNGHFTLNSKTSFAIGKNQRADLKKVAAYFQSKILYSTAFLRFKWFISREVYSKVVLKSEPKCLSLYGFWEK